MRLMAVMLTAALAAPAAQETVKPSIQGGWTLNKELSDQAPARGQRGDGGERGRDGGFGGGGGRRGGGGFGGRGGGMRGGGGGRGQQRDPDEMARLRDAMRDIVDAQDHLVITQTDSMIVITSEDGRTTRLSPDGKKIKDDNTGIERKTRWDGQKLVSEINGAGRGKITQTFNVDPESRRLRIVVQMEDGARSIARVYDPDKQ